MDVVDEFIDYWSAPERQRSQDEGRRLFDAMLEVLLELDRLHDELPKYMRPVRDGDGWALKIDSSKASELDRLHRKIEQAEERAKTVSRAIKEFVDIVGGFSVAELLHRRALLRKETHQAWQRYQNTRFMTESGLYASKKKPEDISNLWEQYERVRDTNAAIEAEIDVIEERARRIVERVVS